MSDFSRRLAVVIGINEYTNGIATLRNAVNDADQIHNVFQQQHNYETHLLLDANATKAQITTLLTKTLPKQVKEDECLLFYFAGHGIALDGDDGPQGYLIPQDAVAGNSSTYLPMNQVHDWLTALPCRHFLTILDCCFAGAFRWSSTRDFATAPEEIYLEHYHRFLEHPAWQVITSASYDETALDALSSLQNDTRSTNGKHSPFAAALIDALKGGADTTPPAQNGKPAGDGVITATELYSYLRDQVETATIEAEKRQTPGLWHLKNHDRGEYIFLTPGHKLNLKNAPPLDESTNPYRGLESFREKDTQLFFGRTSLVEKLYDFVESNCLTVVLGASGSGKSSLVRAGLIPQLRKNQPSWRILKPIRPGTSPFPELNNALKQAKLPKVEVVDTTSAQSGNNLNQSIKIWKTQNPGSKLLLLIDQSEELITLCQDESERQAFVSQLLDAMTNHSDELKVVITVRSDFEPQLRDLFLKLRPKLEDTWPTARFIVPQMTRAELRSVIEKPAEARVMYFEPQELVEQLIDEVADMPGGLPLLSFALSELYLKYLQRQTKAQNQGKILDRSITQADYESIGGVTQSLTQRADEEYKGLVDRDSGYAQIIRHVMLRMVALGSGELARRRVPLSELEYSQQKKGLVKEVIERFTKARLLVRGKDGDGNSYVEPAHDALVRGWQKLLVWKQEDEEGLILQRRLTPAAQEWKSQQQVRFLWHNNPRLDLLKKVSQSDDNWLNNLEAEFVERSVRRKNFNTRRNWGVAIAVMLGLGTGLVFSLIGQKDALIGQIRASRQSAEANFRADQGIDALVDSLRAVKMLKDWPWFLNLPWFKPDNQVQEDVEFTLRKMFYNIKERNRWEAPPGTVWSIFFTRDGQLRVVTADNDIVTLWDKYGKQLAELKGQYQLSRGGISISPDTSKIATLTEEGTIHLWDMEGNKLNKFPEVDQPEVDRVNKCRNCSIDFNPNGDTIALRESDAISLWDMKGNKLKKFVNKEYGRAEFGWNSDGIVIAEKIPKNPEGYCRRITNLSGKRPRILKKNFLCHLFFEIISNPYGKKVGIRYGEASMRVLLFDLESGRTESFTSSFQNVGFSPNGKQLVGTGFEGNIEVVNDYESARDRPFRNEDKREYSNEARKLFKLPKGTVQDLNFSPDGEQLVTLGDEGTIRLWDLERQPLSTFRLPQSGVESISFSSDGQTIATVDSEGVISLLDLQGESIKKFRDIPKVTSVSFSPNGQIIATTGNSGMVRLLNLQGKLIREFQAHSGNVKSVIWSHNGQKIATAGNESDDQFHLDFRVWDTNGNQSNDHKKQHKSGKNMYQANAFQSFSFDQDGELIIVSTPRAETTEGVFLNDISGDRRKEFFGLRSEVGEPIKISHDGKLLIAVRDHSGASTVVFWNLNREKIMEFPREYISIKEIKSFSLSDDNSMLAVIGEDGKTEILRLAGLNKLLVGTCDGIQNYLENNPNVEESDRRLCDGVPEPN